MRGRRFSEQIEVRLIPFCATRDQNEGADQDADLENETESKGKKKKKKKKHSNWMLII